MANHHQKDRLGHFFEALAESELSDVDDPSVDTGENERAEQLRARMLDSIKRVKLERRAKAEQAHQHSLDQLRSSKGRLPETAGQRRALLERSLRQRPDVREITLQNRELTELSNGDVEGLLNKLHHLGALGEGDDGDESSST
jgi:hypothetical protein